MDECPFDSDDNEWGCYDGCCQSCDTYGRVNDLSLCIECAGKIERDLIRQRDWDYTASAYGVPPDGRERLRDDVIKKYGAALELIIEKPSSKETRSSQKKNKRRRA